ncbi:MAG: hypothetical protein R3F05_11970 [Planctomycetota bacterium]
MSTSTFLAAALAGLSLMPLASRPAAAAPKPRGDELAERRERAITKARAWLDDHVFALRRARAHRASPSPSRSTA